MLAELKVRVKEYENEQAEPNEIQRFLESKLDNKLIEAVEKEYRFQKAMEYAGGFISSHEIKPYIGEVKPLTEFEQSNHEPLVPRELYENAVKKIQENRKHTSAEEQSDQSKQDYFFERLDALLPLVDLHELDESCNSVDDSYTKEILKQMHDIFVEVYATDYLENNNYEFVEIPAVIKERKTGHIGLGIVQLDLESSGEHWRNYFLTPRGVIERHQEDIFKDDYNYVMETYIPYDYWYTVTIERDIHVDFDNVPEKISDMLSVCYLDQPEMKME